MYYKEKRSLSNVQLFKETLIFVSVSYMIHLLYKFVQQTEKDEDDNESDNDSEWL